MRLLTIAIVLCLGLSLNASGQDHTAPNYNQDLFGHDGNFLAPSLHNGEGLNAVTPHGGQHLAAILSHQGDGMFLAIVPHSGQGVYLTMNRPHQGEWLAYHTADQDEGYGLASLFKGTHSGSGMNAISPHGGQDMTPDLSHQGDDLFFVQLPHNGQDMYVSNLKHQGGGMMYCSFHQGSGMMLAFRYLHNKIQKFEQLEKCIPHQGSGAYKFPHSGSDVMFALHCFHSGGDAMIAFHSLHSGRGALAYQFFHQGGDSLERSVS